MSNQPEPQVMDKAFWEAHWKGRDQRAGRDLPAHPYLATETSGLEPGTALDAGCGEGAEAVWLASHGWSVTAADISAEALARTSLRVAEAGLSDQVHLVEADLETWEPDSQFDLVTTHYAHSAAPQLVLYDRISQWVAPGGTLLIVGHLDSAGARHGHGHGHGHGGGHPPEEVTVTAASGTATLDPNQWDVVTAAEPVRTVRKPDGSAVHLRDVVVRATRRH